MNQENDKITKLRKIYGYLASSTIVLTIIHLLGFILLQTQISLDDSTKAFKNTFGLMLSFNSTQLACTLFSNNLNVSLVKASGAIFSIVLGLIIIFLSSQAVKGKFIYHYIGVGLYFLDTLCIIPEIILSLLKIYPLNLDVVSIIVTLIIHVIAIAVLVYSLVIARKLQKDEENKPLYDSKENKSL